MAKNKRSDYNSHSVDMEFDETPDNFGPIDLDMEDWEPEDDEWFQELLRLKNEG